MSELREKASLELARKMGWSLQTVQEADRAGGTVRFNFPDVIGLIESRLLTEQQRDQARELLQKVGMHLDELSDAWRRSALVSQDGKNGVRSNVNHDLLMAVDKFLIAPPAADAQEGR
jgi:hypothetical protein